jgi:hypothetical protein
MSRTDGVEELGRYIPIRSSEDRKFPYVRSPLYGDVPAPQTLSELFQYLEDIAAMSIWDCWRGQANIRWRLDSTAARRMLLHDTDIEEIIYEGSFEERVRNYETRLLNQARMAGHGIHRGRELSDLELLSVLRHYGAATRLMDFSRNVLIALWFACSGSENRDEYGLLVGVEANNARHLRTEEDLRKPITDLIDEKRIVAGPNGEEWHAIDYWYWEPRHLFERMRVQQSLFVFGHAIQNDWGTAPFHLDPSTKRYRETGDDSIVISDDSALIAISPRLKADMEDGRGNRSYWRELFGYDARSLFPDLEGFSSYHGAQQEFEKTFFIR